MKITQAVASIEDGYPVLNLTIDGRSAFVVEPKLTLLDAGIVVLLDGDAYWEQTLSADYECPESAVTWREEGMIRAEKPVARIAGG